MRITGTLHYQRAADLRQMTAERSALDLMRATLEAESLFAELGTYEPDHGPLTRPRLRCTLGWRPDQPELAQLDMAISPFGNGQLRVPDLGLVLRWNLGATTWALLHRGVLAAASAALAEE